VPTNRNKCNQHNNRDGGEFEPPQDRKFTANCESDVLGILASIAIQIETCRNFAGFIWERLYRTLQQTTAA
jgi:hypothetical protein